MYVSTFVLTENIALLTSWQC